MRRPLLVVAGMIVLSTAIGAGAYAASELYGQYGSPRTPLSARSWAERPPTYLASDCRGCHRDATARAAASAHERLLCETCHVPAVDHPGPVVGVVQMLPPANDEQCVTCHERTDGRPLGFAQIVPARHYSGADCAACHEPHAASAVAPRAVTHPLERLPECITCHAPEGIKSFPANHQAAADAVCLACHRRGAGDK
jgi:hypothetical protein